jgi:nucleoside-diphosphate-sugar epimerase
MILVTGASGFLGRRIVQLALEQGRAVRALVRNPSNATHLPAHCLHQGDITDPGTLDSAVAGVEAVIHAAATTSETTPNEELSRRTNVEGTRSLMEAFSRSGGRRWIQISSLSANPANTSVYGRTKLAADEEVMRSGLQWTILRPGTIYGPGARGLFAKIVRLVNGLPLVPVLGPGTEPMRPIFVDDCANAALHCLDHPRTVGQTYPLGCRDVVDFNEFLRGVLRAQGKSKPLFHVPLWICFPAARVMGWVLKNPPVTVDNLVGLKQMQAPDISAAERDFGFAPLTFAEGLHQTFQTEETAVVSSVSLSNNERS